MASFAFSTKPTILKRFVRDQESVERVEIVLTRELSKNCQGSRIGNLHRASQKSE